MINCLLDISKYALMYYCTKYRSRQNLNWHIPSKAVRTDDGFSCRCMFFNYKCNMHFEQRWNLLTVVDFFSSPIWCQHYLLLCNFQLTKPVSSAQLFIFINEFHWIEKSTIWCQLHAPLFAWGVDKWFIFCLLPKSCYSSTDIVVCNKGHGSVGLMKP